MPDDDLFQGPPQSDQPITMLRELEEPASGYFLVKIHRKIRRRETIRNFSAFAWFTPGSVLVEFGSLLLHVLRSASPSAGRAK